jgi:hypothetical protein
MGIRSKEDTIVPFSLQSPELGSVEGIADTDAGGATQELLFTGRVECVPDCVQRLVSFVYSSIIPFVSSFILQNDVTAEKLAGSLPPTQQVNAYNDSSADTTGSLPPSDFSMQEDSLVTNSEVDTQVIHDLVKGRIGSDRWQRYSNHVVNSDCSFCDDLQPRPLRGYSACVS